MIRKVLSASICAFTLLVTSLPVYAEEIENSTSEYSNENIQYQEEYTEYEIGDIEFEITEDELLHEGATVIITRNPDGSIKQLVTDEEIEAFLNQPKTKQKRSAGDGVLEFVTFHIGFNNWNNDTGRLYMVISSDEPLSMVSGNAYVKNIDLLNPKVYHDSSFSHLLRGQSSASRVLNEHVNTGKDKIVRIGYSNVIFTSIYGETGSVSSKSSLVTR